MRTTDNIQSPSPQPTPGAGGAVGGRQAARGVARASVPAPGSRLPGPHKERKPALAALGVLLVLIGALASAFLVLQTGDRVSAIRIVEDVPAGQQIPGSAMREISVARHDAPAQERPYVVWGARGDVNERYVSKYPIPAGSLLAPSMLEDIENSKWVGDEWVEVGVEVSGSQAPFDLQSGSVVAVYGILDDAPAADGAGGEASQIILTEEARVSEVQQDEGGGAFGSRGGSARGIKLLVHQDDAPLVAQAANGNGVVLAVLRQAGE